MSNDRRRPTQRHEIVEPAEQRRLQLALHAGAKSQGGGSVHLVTLVELLCDSGIDCSDFVELAEQRPTVH